jgi:hypothetical protein
MAHQDREMLRVFIAAVFNASRYLLRTRKTWINIMNVFL